MLQIIHFVQMIHILQVIQTPPGEHVQIPQIPLRYIPVSIRLIQHPSRLNMLQTSVQHPDSTDPPDHTEMPQIIQILQIIHILQIMQTHPQKCAYHADRTSPFPV